MLAKIHGIFLYILVIREQFWNSAQSLIGLTQDMGKIWEPLEGLTANVKFSWDAWNTTSQRRYKTQLLTMHMEGQKMAV